MGGWIVEKVKSFQRSQYFQVFQNFFKVPQLVVVDRESLHIQKNIENAINVIDFVRVDKKVFNSETFFKAFERSESVVIEPDNLQVRKELKVDKDSGLETTHMKLGCLLGLLMVFNRNSVPRVPLHFLANRRVLSEKVIHGLVHSVIQYSELILTRHRMLIVLK